MAAKGAKPMSVNGVVYSTNDLVPAYNSTSATTTTSKSTSNKSTNSKTDYTSEGVKDNNIAYLKSSDWEFLGALTVLALFVRLFRIYQPSSVVYMVTGAVLLVAASVDAISRRRAAATGRV